MKTLIIPCAGGKRIEGRPKYLALHPSGKLLIEKCIEGIAAESFDRIVVTIPRRDIDSFNALEIVDQTLGRSFPVDVFILEEETSGPAETVYRTILGKDITGQIVIKDSDNYLKVDMMDYTNFVAGLDLDEWEHDIRNLRNKSFLIVNEQKQILDIIEKSFRSDVICLGLYGFREAADFTFAYERVNDRSYPINKIYVSHIISYLIGYSQRVFYYIDSSDYENWGNDKVWQDVQSQYATCFVDFDSTVKNFTLTDLVTQSMEKIRERGGRIVGFTSGDAASKDKYSKLLQEKGLEGIEIVSCCTSSNSHILIRDVASLLEHSEV